jgi:hypothetical protein
LLGNAAVATRNGSAVVELRLQHRSKNVTELRPLLGLGSGVRPFLHWNGTVSDQLTLAGSASRGHFFRKAVGVPRESPIEFDSNRRGLTGRPRKRILPVRSTESGLERCERIIPQNNWVLTECALDFVVAVCKMDLPSATKKTFPCP